MQEQFVSFFSNMPMQKREQLIGDLRSCLEARSEIIYAYVFGSFLTGMPFRDIDLAVYVNLQERSNLQEAYAELLSQAFKEIFDVIVINDAPNSLKCSIFREGRILVCKEEFLLSQCMEACSLDMLANEGISRESLKEIVW